MEGESTRESFEETSSFVLDFKALAEAGHDFHYVYSSSEAKALAQADEAVNQGKHARSYKAWGFFLGGVAVFMWGALGQLTYMSFGGYASLLVLAILSLLLAGIALAARRTLRSFKQEQKALYQQLQALALAHKISLMESVLRAVVGDFKLIESGRYSITGHLLSSDSYFIAVFSSREFFSFSADSGVMHDFDMKA